MTRYKCAYNGVRIYYISSNVSVSTHRSGKCLLDEGMELKPVSRTKTAQMIRKARRDMNSGQNPNPS